MGFLADESVQRRNRNLILPGWFPVSLNSVGANAANFTAGNSLAVSVAGFLPGDYGMVFYCLGNDATGLTFPAGWTPAVTLPVTNGSVGGTVYMLTRIMQAGDINPVFSRTGGTGNIIGTLQSWRNMREPGTFQSNARVNQPDVAQYPVPPLNNRFRNARVLTIAIKAAPDVVGWASLAGIAPNYAFGGSTFNEGAASNGQWSVLLEYGQAQTRSASGLLVNRGAVPAVYSVAQLVFG